MLTNNLTLVILLLFLGYYFVGAFAGASMSINGVILGGIVLLIMHIYFFIISKKNEVNNEI